MKASDRDSIEAQLLRLPPQERARLADLLLASLDAAREDALVGETRAEVDEAWATEVERRYKDLESGAVAGIPAAEVYADIEAELRAINDPR